MKLLLKLRPIFNSEISVRQFIFLKNVMVNLFHFVQS